MDGYWETIIEDYQKRLWFWEMEGQPWFRRVPGWVSWSFVPWLGSIVEMWIGYRHRFVGLQWLGLVWFVAGGLLGPWSLGGICVWVAQAATAVWYRPLFLAKTYPPYWPLPPIPAVARQILQYRPPVDLNHCTLEDLVCQLGLPVVYARDIILLQRSGYWFTEEEDLVQVVGMPRFWVDVIKPGLHFGYSLASDPVMSWRRVNHWPLETLVRSGLSPAVARILVEERQAHGPFWSIADIVRRTGISVRELYPLL